MVRAMLHQVRKAPPKQDTRWLSESERQILLNLARTVCPGGQVFPPADEHTVAQTEAFMLRVSPAARTGYRALLRGFNSSSLLRHARRFQALSADKQLRWVDQWRTAGLSRRMILRALMSPVKAVYFGNPSFHRQLGCVYDDYSARPEAEPRYMTERAHSAANQEVPAELECDVIVVGTGAGGAVVAKELAERGHAVVMVEEGAFFKRTDFSDNAFDMQRDLYHGAGLTGTIGNVPVLLPQGTTVGGSTTINSGTCYRIPNRVLRKWREEFGLTELTPNHLAPYYERVEHHLRVERARADHLGGAARVIARGCEALGYEHKPLRRNAPDCDGQGMCCFGCPTDAKRSTNVSYVPLALKAGAQLFHNARVTRILVEAGRAVGVVAHSVDPKAESHVPRALTIRARTVVISGGALNTPVLLINNNLANSSGMLGKNLSIHPTLAVNAVFDEEIAGYNAIPQGYAIEEFRDEGLLFEGGSIPLDVNMAAIMNVGPDLMELAENYRHVATFGFMVEDSSRGRVRVVRGQRVVTYNVNKRDVARMKRGMEILTNVFLAAGAREVRPWLHGFDPIRTQNDLERFRRARLRASDFDLTAYHPLGTARMGSCPDTSVVDANNQCHDVRGLYVVDGASIPSSVAVNPMVTIMAMATRAAERIDLALTN